MSALPNPPKLQTSHLHAANLFVALLAGIVSVTGGIYSLKTNMFGGGDRGSLQGIVLDDRIAKPLKLASVEVADAEGAVVNTAITDDKGYYRIKEIKTGNYVVTFKAPLHRSETKNIKIEKGLASSLYVDLVPETSQPAVTVPEPRSTLPQTVPVQPPVLTRQETPSLPSTETQPPGPIAPPRTGSRKHPRRGYPSEPTGTSSGTSQSNPWVQTGVQLFEEWMKKKSDQNSTRQPL